MTRQYPRFVHIDLARRGGMRGSDRLRSGGAVLLVAVLLLLLASIVSVFALRVASSEQRASGNDLRTKLLQQVADSALSQAAELLLSDPGIVNDRTSGTWQACVEDDVSFPCGAVVASRRSSMYRYVGGTADVFGGGSIDAMEQRMLPLGHRITHVNDSAAGETDGFAVRYGVGAVLCRLVPRSIDAAGSQCASGGSEIGEAWAVTLVAVAELGNEGARTTAIKSFATGATYVLADTQPPVMASGPVDIGEASRVVASPDAGGPGAAVSIWTRKAVGVRAMPETCRADAFFGSGDAVWFPAADAPVRSRRCDACGCGLDALTRVYEGRCLGGSDVLSNPGPECTDATSAVSPEAFPCDLFEHVFGMQARRDADGDHFCERRIVVQDPVQPDMSVGIDEFFLATEADWIVSGTSGYGARFSADPRRIDCAALSSKRGLIWLRSPCVLTGTVGNPGAPALVVADDSLRLDDGTAIFGVVYLRDGSADDLDPARGGRVRFRINGRAALYGALIVQGAIDSPGGSITVVHDSGILRDLRTQMRRVDLFGLPGGWTDSLKF